MKTFKIKNGFNIEKRLTDNGFTMYDGEEPMWAAKIQKGEYITVTRDFETVNIYYTPEGMTDKQFVQYLTGNGEDYNKYLAPYCAHDYEDTRCNLLFALGIT